MEPQEAMTSFLAGMVLGGGGVELLKALEWEGTHSTPTAVLEESRRIRVTWVE